jgi:hypothetical protein
MGLVINRHYSAAGLYDTALFVEASSCCEDPAQCTSCHPEAEKGHLPDCCKPATSDCNPQVPVVSAPVCCFDITEVFLFSENLFPGTQHLVQIPDFKLLAGFFQPIQEAGIISLLIDSDTPPQEPPPFDQNRDIYLQISVFRC